MPAEAQGEPLAGEPLAREPLARAPLAGAAPVAARPAAGRGLAAGLPYLAVSVCLFGGIWPVTKAALAEATPLWFAVNRAGLAALASALLLTLLRRLRWPERHDLVSIAGIGLLQLGAFFALTHLALEWVPAGRTAILANVTVFWLIPLSVWLLGDRVSRRQWLAVLVGLLGVLVLMRPWDLLGQGLGALPGYAMLLVASLCWSLAILVTRRFPPQRPVLELLPWCFAVGTALLLPLALWREPGGGIGPGAWPHAAFVGAVAAPIGTWATVEAGRRLSGIMASVGFLAVPALGVALSNLWLGERLGWDVLAGGLLIGASVLCAARG
ncbi:EamA/RhaT family transporter [Roseicella frigidaeris]|uniref:EamA/RhaT family transporter n=2 Tax=Roseicella frigidaeris TaxID=2230885 RepID=A0A327M8T1_9PROT|nr:EamA/RhaT family transporter [Roseicella frigidaeris]